MRIGDVNIISREDAGLVAPKERRFIHRPAPRSWIHYTGGDPDVDLSRREVHRRPRWSESVFKESILSYWRGVQAFHMNTRKWNDIGYSFGVAPGIFGLRPRVLEGRGAGVLGAHTEGDNEDSLGIVILIGPGRRIGRRVRRKIRKLLDALVAIGELEGPRRKHPTGGHRDAPGAATACPGDDIMKHINTLRRPIERSR